MPKSIGGTELRKMVAAGAKVLEINRAKVDSLNVFPVPDGDTGTNMSLTIQSAVKEMNLCTSNRLSELCDAVSKGALKGARGNSGVILSQLFRGICAEIKKHDDVSIKTFARAMENGTRVAYAAVSKPKEGTVLTVARMMSEYAVASAAKFREFPAFLEEVIKKGEEALANTPEQLPVLKKAGVVDAGGMGLLCIYRGFLGALNGEEVAEELSAPEAQKSDEDVFGDNSDIINLDLGEIVFAYCTEFFIINLKKQTTLADIDRLKEKLLQIGDCVICIGDLELVKVHVHTNTPGVALSYALELGELDRVKIENMLEQNRAMRAKREAEKKEMGMLAICAGEGLEAIFKDLLVDRVIEGGQTMNPSASDIADAVQKVNAEHVFVFPTTKTSFSPPSRRRRSSRGGPSTSSRPRISRRVCRGARVQRGGDGRGEQDGYAARARQRARGAVHLCGAQHASQRVQPQRRGHHRAGRQEDPRQGGQHRRHDGEPRGEAQGQLARDHHPLLRQGSEGGGRGRARRAPCGEIPGLRRGLPFRRAAGVLLHRVA